MKILHIVAGDLIGGAARGAYWLHCGLRDLGVESKIFTNSETDFGDKSVITCVKSKFDKAKNLIRGEIDNLFTAFYPRRKKDLFSLGVFGVDFTKIPEYKDADIIHLHWINKGFVNIKHLAKIKKPIVWTVRDMWAMTGGCHCSFECDNYKNGCGNCVQLQSKFKYDLSRYVFNRKKKYLPRDIRAVGVSSWMTETLAGSKLFKNSDIRTISNNIDTAEFFPIDKERAREILGLKTVKKIVLVGAGNLKDVWKGFPKYIEAVKLLDKNKYLFCLFGKLDERAIRSLDVEYRNFGFLHDNVSLRLLYSAADVFVVPSLMDSFGKTLVEAMCCRTPVVCFDATGPKDIVDHKINGYCATPFEPKSLAEGIEWVLNCPNYDGLCKNAREKVLKKFDSEVIAKKYIELYEEILKG